MALAPAGLPVTPTAVSPVGFGRLAARRVPRADGASDHGRHEAQLICCLGFAVLTWKSAWQKKMLVVLSSFNQLSISTLSREVCK